MPILAVFAAAAQVRHGIDTTKFEPRRHAHAEARGLRDVEAAVAVEIRRVGAVKLQAFPVR